MLFPDCYNQKHTSALNKISGRLTEGREFLLSCNPKMSIVENSKQAYHERWYGNASENRCNELTRHFFQRYYISSNGIDSLRKYVKYTGGRDFHWINHFFMLMNNKYYRWAVSEFMADRYSSGLLEIPRSRFDQELKKQLPKTVGDGSLVRYGRNLLTAVRDNGLLEGKVKKSIVSPSITVESLSFMLYFLFDCGFGSTEFDDSPLFRSLLKPRELLVPLFLDGERLGYWEFTGDRESLRFNYSFTNLEKWLDFIS